MRSHLLWRTIEGGARNALSTLLALLEDQVHGSSWVVAVRRDADAVRLRMVDGATHETDAVVLAAHADHSLALLEDPADRENGNVGAWRSCLNDRYEHNDAFQFAPKRSARASWNHHVKDCEQPTSRASLSCDMNRLKEP